MNRDQIRAHITEIWSDTLPGTDPDGAFLDQGGSSLTAVLMVTRLEEVFGVVLPFSVLVTAAGVDGIASWIIDNPA